MGKSKRTRWRTFEIEPQDDKHASNKDNLVSSRGYYRNQEPHVNNKFEIQNFPASDDYNRQNHRTYRENPNRHRQGPQHRSWQRKPNRESTYSSNTVNGAVDDENGATPMKFNEDEFIRICTPRSDVLFKKGYLSRLVENTAHSAESACNISDSSNDASDTIYDNGSSSATPSLSPPISTAYAQEYGGPVVYYEDNGMFVMPIYNGMSPTSPVLLMYPFQYDPFYNVACGQVEIGQEDGIIQSSDVEQDCKEQTDASVPFDGASFSDEAEPLKTRRRKRFSNARNPQFTQSTDTTSDDDITINSQVNHVEPSSYQNNRKLKDFHLNVDVEEFRPRRIDEIPTSNDETVTEPITKSIESDGLATKKERKYQPTKKKPIASKSPRGSISDNNFIKNIIDEQVEVQDTLNRSELPQNEVDEKPASKSSHGLLRTEKSKKDIAQATKVNSVKSKKPKSKNRKRKPCNMGRQDGFEIIEPEFPKNPTERLGIELSASIDDQISDSDASLDLPNKEESCSTNTSDAVALPPVDLTDESAIKSEDPEAAAIDTCPTSMFDDRCDIAALERELLENLRLCDGDVDIDLKGPIINKIIDFPITFAVTKWLQSVSNDPLELWNIENASKLGLDFQYDDEDTASEMSDFHPRSETDSDYSSDFQTKNNSPTNHYPSTQCNNVGDIPKKLKSESFCALM